MSGDVSREQHAAGCERDDRYNARVREKHRSALVYTDNGRACDKHTKFGQVLLDGDEVIIDLGSRNYRQGRLVNMGVLRQQLLGKASADLILDAADALFALTEALRTKNINEQAHAAIAGQTPPSEKERERLGDELDAMAENDPGLHMGQRRTLQRAATLLRQADAPVGSAKT